MNTISISDCDDIIGTDDHQTCVTPKIVNISLEFLRIGEIDIINERYFAEIQLNISWEDNLIQEYNPAKHWNPRIYVENLFVKPEEVVQHRTITINDVTNIWEMRRIRAHFWEKMELYCFPLDVQELSITLSSKLDTSCIKFNSKEFALNRYVKFIFVEQQRWKLLQLVDVTHDTSYDLGSCESLNNCACNTNDFQKWINRPRLCVKTYAIRRPAYYFLNAYSLIFVITITALTFFSIDCKLPQNRLQTSAIVLLTSVSFKWVVNRSLPTVNYTTSLDRYSITCIFYLSLLCTWHAIIGCFWDDHAEAKKIDQWALLALSLLFILIHVIFGISFFKSYLRVRKYLTKEEAYIKLTQKKAYNKLNRF